MDYFNTNRETGDVLKQSIATAFRQQHRVLYIFQSSPRALFSPEEIHRHFDDNVPLTSIRRAITNLTQEGKLEKTTHMSVGKYGKKVHLWRYKGE